MSEPELIRSWFIGHDSWKSAKSPIEKIWLILAITVKVIAQMFFIGPIGTFQKSYLLNIITEKRSLTTVEPFNALKKLFRCKTRNETEFISKWNIIHRETQKITFNRWKIVVMC